MLPAGALRILIEEKFGSLPYLFIYALLEWLLIILLFVDGFLSFVSNEIARLFELQTPCLLCTRIDHVLVHKTSNLYCNESICEVHKRDISTLTYCHLHKRLSDIRSMCQGCLLSSDRRKKYELEIVGNERIGILRCSCCGEPLSSRLSLLLPASPRTPTFDAKYTELKLMTANTTQDAHLHFVDTHGRGDMVEDEPRTPHFTDRNRFFGIPLTDGATPGSPKRLELVMEEGEGEGEGDIVARLKRQLTLDRRSLMALYMELDEERSASAVAANNAMAMITRLQEEKAAVQMEALQYQRMMEEQAEYDQEAMQMMKDMLFKRDEELKALEYEVREYRDRYGGVVDDVDVETHLSEVDLDLDQDHQHMEEESKIQDELAVLDYEGERCHLLSLLREIELKMYSTSEKASTSVEEDEERKTVVTREVALIRERLRAVEAESVFLKNVAMSLQRGGEGVKVLSEIAQHLRKLRQNHDVY